MTALPTLAPRQPTGDLAAVLEDIEMSPGERFGVVAAKDQTAVLGATRRLSETWGLADLQNYRPALPLEAALDHFPVQPQTQQFMKQFPRCHARRLFTARFHSTENSGEPEFFIKIKKPHLCFHCLRVTDVNRLRRAGVMREAAMRFVNHASELVHQIYQRERVEDLARWRDAVTFPALARRPERN